MTITFEGELFGTLYQTKKQNKDEVTISCSSVNDKDGNNWSLVIYPPWSSEEEVDRCVTSNKQGKCTIGRACSGDITGTSCTSPFRYASIHTVNITINAKIHNRLPITGNWKCVRSRHQKQKSLLITAKGRSVHLIRLRKVHRYVNNICSQY